MLAAVGLMAFSIQDADEGQGVIPHTVEIAHWLETALWVNANLLLVGAVLVLAGAVVCLSPRHDWTLGEYILRLAIPVVVVIAALCIFIVWEVLGADVNLTSGWPQ
jgi:hypothetical protein